MGVARGVGRRKREDVASTTLRLTDPAINVKRSKSLGGSTRLDLSDVSNNNAANEVIPTPDAHRPRTTFDRITSLIPATSSKAASAIGTT